MDIYEFMEGYDREFDENEFDARLWEAMNEQDFELDDVFEEFLHTRVFKAAAYKKTGGIYLKDCFP